MKIQKQCFWLMVIYVALFARFTFNDPSAFDRIPINEWYTVNPFFVFAGFFLESIARAIVPATALLVLTGFLVNWWPASSSPDTGQVSDT